MIRFTRDGSHMVVRDGDQLRLLPFDGAHQERQITVEGLLDVAAFDTAIWVVSGSPPRLQRRGLDGELIGPPLALPPGDRLVAAPFGEPSALWLGAAEPVEIRETRPVGATLEAADGPTLGAGLALHPISREDYVLPLSAGRRLELRDGMFHLTDGEERRTLTAAGQHHATRVVDGTALFDERAVALLLETDAAQTILVMSTQGGVIQHRLGFTDVRRVSFAAQRGHAMLQQGDSRLLILDLRFGKVVRRWEQEGTVLDCAVDGGARHLVIRRLGAAGPEILYGSYRDLIGAAGDTRRPIPIIVADTSGDPAVARAAAAAADSSASGSDGATEIASTDHALSDEMLARAASPGTDAGSGQGEATGEASGQASGEALGEGVGATSGAAAADLRAGARAGRPSLPGAATAPSGSPSSAPRSPWTLRSRNGSGEVAGRSAEIAPATTNAPTSRVIGQRGTFPPAGPTRSRGVAVPSPSRDEAVEASDAVGPSGATEQRRAVSFAAASRSPAAPLSSLRSPEQRPRLRAGLPQPTRGPIASAGHLPAPALDQRGAPRTPTELGHPGHPGGRGPSPPGLDEELLWIAALCERAMAEAWDTGRLAPAVDGELPGERELQALLHPRAGLAPEKLAATELQLAVSEEARGGSPAARHRARVLDALGLSPLGRDIVLLVAAPSLWAEFGRVYEILAGPASAGDREPCNELLLGRLLSRHPRAEIAAELDPEALLLSSGIVLRGAGGRPLAGLEVDPTLVRRLRVPV